MRFYCVAIRKGDKTDVKFLTSGVKQKAEFVKYKDMEDADVWMYGPIEFTLNGPGILKALNYGKESVNVTVDNCDDVNDH